MPDILKNKGAEIPNALWLRFNATQDGLPADCVAVYRQLFNTGLRHLKKTIDNVIQHEGGSITVPMQPEYLERYFTGFMFEYRPFYNLSQLTKGVEGYWEYDPQAPSHVIIHYNKLALSGRQRYSKVHELFHFAQSVDDEFLTFFDNLILNTTLPEAVVYRLLERVTEKATAMYLMPNDFFLKKYHEIKNQSGAFEEAQIKQLASAFDVSVQAARFRLQECLGTRMLVPQPVPLHMPP